MSSLQSLSCLSFFKVTELRYSKQTSYDFREVPRPHYCVGLILKGRAVFTSGDISVSVGEGDIIFVPIGSCYMSQWQGEPEILDISLHFSFSPYGPFARDARPMLQKLTPPNLSEYQTAFRRMLEWQKGDVSEQLMALGIFYRILGELLPMVRCERVQSYDSRIAKAVEYIDYHYDRVLTVSELAAIANMSESYFYSRFRAEVGMSPIEYKLRKCIDRAVLLLLGEEDLSVEEISDRLGFESAAYFRRVFRRFMGKSPMQYKKGVPANA
jgi:AraC-like DNA-binding protein